MSASLQLQTLQFTGEINNHRYSGMLSQTGQIKVYLRLDTGRSIDVTVNSGEIDTVVATLLEIKERLTGQYILNELVAQTTQIVDKTEGSEGIGYAP